MTDSPTQTVSIDGVSYMIDKLPEPAQAQLRLIMAAEQALTRIETQWAVWQTARKVYLAALTEELAQVPVLGPDDPVDAAGTVNINGQRYAASQLSESARAYLAQMLAMDKEQERAELHRRLFNTAKEALCTQFKAQVTP